MADHETKRVSDTEYEKAYDEMCRSFEEQTGYNGRWDEITFRFASVDRDWRSPKTMQINWAAIGNTPPEEAAAYGKALMIAAKLAENFIYNGYTVYYED